MAPRSFFVLPAIGSAGLSKLPNPSSQLPTPSPTTVQTKPNWLLRLARRFDKARGSMPYRETATVTGISGTVGWTRTGTRRRAAGLHRY